MILEVKSYLQQLQKSICSTLEKEESHTRFIEDIWAHAEGGGGVTCILSNGSVIEKGGVNFSHVMGRHLPATATIARPELKECAFQALGISVVIHPVNPYAPTSHANIRFFMAEKSDGTTIWWFGGGFDLTPYYGFVEDCEHWHHTAKKACDPFGKDVYPQLKKACDDYFYLKHRQEARGIGGLFFDDLNQWGFEKSFHFIKNIGNHYIQAYQPILNKRKNISFGARERDFQLYRRGRYVEFNLVYDRGTLFGLQSGGRIESILMSLPPAVTWEYNRPIKPNTPEADLYQHFLPPKEWVSG